MVGLLSFVRLSSHLRFGNLRRVTKITKKPYSSQARSLSKDVSLIRRGAFKIAVLLTSIVCGASSEAAAPGNVFDRCPDRVPSLWEHSSQAAIMFTWADALRNNIDRQTQFIRQATELQKRVAAQNAKAYYARLGAEKKNELKKKNIHYLAVPTVRTQETSSKAKEVVMVWSIDQKRLVGQNVCELKKVPRAGELGTYDKKKAEYIGKGPETTVMALTNEGPSISTTAFAKGSRTGC